MNALADCGADLPRYPRDPACPQQRIWRRCVFVDWHGVLCDLPFWHSIVANPRHQQRRRIEAELVRLFTDRRELVDLWMRGTVDAMTVTATLEEPEDRRCNPHFLYRRLFEDCRSMSPRPRLLRVLGELPELTGVVLATDNMDCFSESIPALQSLRPAFDAVLCSSDLGVLKSEDPQRFFGDWLREQGVGAAEAVLIDDAERNCVAFEELGGTAIHYSDPERAIAELETWAATP